MLLKVGQVLWLKIRYNNSGEVADKEHPYLILFINEKMNYIEVAQFDSFEGKKHKAFSEKYYLIFADRPPEKVITKDSFINLDSIYMIEYFDDLIVYRKTIFTLSLDKLIDATNAYVAYQDTHHIDENKIVSMTKEEIKYLNRK